MADKRIFSVQGVHKVCYHLPYKDGRGFGDEGSEVKRNGMLSVN